VRRVEAITAGKSQCSIFEDKLALLRCSNEALKHPKDVMQSITAIAKSQNSRVTEASRKNLSEAASRNVKGELKTKYKPLEESNAIIEEVDWMLVR